MHKIEMHLSQKEKIFSLFLSAFFKSALNSEHSQKKEDVHSLYNSQITDHEKPA